MNKKASSKSNAKKVSASKHLLDLRQSQVARGISNGHQIVAGKAKGGKLWDLEGKEYLDWVGGIGVLNVGHNHPKVIAAAKKQLDLFTHTCFQVAMYDGYISLANRLNKLAPISGPKKTALFTTGAEATENAIKIARAYTGRPGVISFAHSFHGRTLMGMSLTGKASYYKQNFGPFAPEIYHTPAPYLLRGMTCERARDALYSLFETTVSPDRVAAIILEPVMGEGGFLPIQPGFFKVLREICDKHGIVLIADEIQSGFGRTGKMFAIEHMGIEPDLIAIAKSLAGGLPLSGVIGKATIMDAPAPGGLGGTYAGNPVACAAAMAVLDIFEQDKLLARAEKMGKTMRAALQNMASQFPEIAEVRGLGPMLAIEFVKDEQLTPAPEIATRVVEEARSRGLLLLKAGMWASCIRFLTPLVVSETELKQGLAILEASIAAATGRAGKIRKAK